MRISVVLPAPFSPTRACTSPARTSRLASRTASTPGNSFRTPSRWSSGTPVFATAPSLPGEGIVLREQPAGNQVHRRHLFARHVGGDGFDRLLADGVRLLHDVRVDPPGPDGLPSL